MRTSGCCFAFFWFLRNGPRYSSSSLSCVLLACAYRSRVFGPRVPSLFRYGVLLRCVAFVGVAYCCVRRRENYPRSKEASRFFHDPGERLFVRIASHRAARPIGTCSQARVLRQFRLACCVRCAVQRDECQWSSLYDVIGPLLQSIRPGDGECGDASVVPAE
jgi:hypothetical protein